MTPYPVTPNKCSSPNMTVHFLLRNCTFGMPINNACGYEAAINNNVESAEEAKTCFAGLRRCVVVEVRVITSLTDTHRIKVDHNAQRVESIDCDVIRCS